MSDRRTGVSPPRRSAAPLKKPESGQELADQLSAHVRHPYIEDPFSALAWLIDGVRRHKERCLYSDSERHKKLKSEFAAHAHRLEAAVSTVVFQAHYWGGMARLTPAEMREELTGFREATNELIHFQTVPSPPTDARERIYAADFGDRPGDVDTHEQVRRHDETEERLDALTSQHVLPFLARLSILAANVYGRLKYKKNVFGRSVPNQARTGKQATPDALPKLRKDTEPLKLTGNAARIIDLLCRRGSGIPLADIAIACEWEVSPNGDTSVFQSKWNSARDRLNQKLSKKRWRISTLDGKAMATPVEASARK